jgi:DNA-binding NarL/FixJ family response regulator
VMLADDHAVVRAGYKRFIETDDSIRVVAEASTGEEVYFKPNMYSAIVSASAFDTCG